VQIFEAVTSKSFTHVSSPKTIDDLLCKFSWLIRLSVDTFEAKKDLKIFDYENIYEPVINDSTL
jgi:hypothetical protein